MRNITPLRTLALLAILLLAAESAAAQYGIVGEAGCRVLTLPATISEPGLYCLEEDWEVYGTAIVIVSDHVTVDFQGHVVRYLSTDESLYGVYAYERSGIVLRNGSLIGFPRGISLNQRFGGWLSTNHLVEEMRISDTRYYGVVLSGHQSVVRDNVVWKVAGNDGSPVTGIFVLGYGNRILDNEVSTVTSSDPSLQWGIRLFTHFGSAGGLVVGNRLSGTGNGIYMTTGTAYRDNFVMLTPSGSISYSGGVDAGGNFAN